MSHQIAIFYLQTWNGNFISLMYLLLLCMATSDNFICKKKNKKQSGLSIWGQRVLQTASYLPTTPQPCSHVRLRLHLRQMSRMGFMVTSDQQRSKKNANANTTCEWTFSTLLSNQRVCTWVLVLTELLVSGTLYWFIQSKRFPTVGNLEQNNRVGVEVVIHR